MQKVLNPKLSVIVTVYNTEKYITDCLQSVISQSRQNFEIIIVDGGYPDKSMEICRQFAEKYDNITIVKSEGKGPGDSRNCGMAVAKGEYVTFVDGDDVIDTDMYCQLMKEIEENNLDAVYCTCYRFFDDDLSNRSMRNISESDCTTNGEIAQQMILPLIASTKAGVEIAGSMCMAVYRRSIIEKNNLAVKPMEEVFSEDNFFNIEFLSYAERAKAVNSPLYFYRRHMGSVSNRVHDYTVPALKRFAEYTKQIGKRLGLDAREVEKRNRIRFIVTFSAVVKKKIDALPLGEVKRYLKETIDGNRVDLSFSRDDLSCVEFQVKLFWILMRYKLYTPLYLLVKVYSRFVAR
ncbi:MAG: glycosyltransferase [Oscillospiraceae bacterium]|nr:glycosyltransferase [Oscillospiraceae bacterium]